MEILISTQRGHKSLLLVPIGFSSKIISDELNNPFIKEPERTKFEPFGNSQDRNEDLDAALESAFEQKIKHVRIGVTLTSNMNILSKLNIESISFSNCLVDNELFPVLENVKFLSIDDSVKMDISNIYFPNLVHLSFHSLKTFKGKLLNKLEKVEKVIIWYENKKLNGMLPMLPNLQHLQINHGSLAELDLSTNKMLETLSLHYCTKLEKVMPDPSLTLKAVVVERCKLLDLTNLGDNVQIWKGV